MLSEWGWACADCILKAPQVLLLDNSQEYGENGGDEGWGWVPHLDLILLSDVS